MCMLRRIWCQAAAPLQFPTCTLLRLSTTLASSLVRSDRGSLNTPPSLPLCRSLEGPRTCSNQGSLSASARPGLNLAWRWVLAVRCSKPDGHLWAALSAQARWAATGLLLDLPQAAAA